MRTANIHVTIKSLDGKEVKLNCFVKKEGSEISVTAFTVLSPNHLKPLEIRQIFGKDEAAIEKIIIAKAKTSKVFDRDEPIF
jgi:hypothetical protein